MSSAVLSVPSATQGGSLLWLFGALGVVVLVYLVFMGLLFTLLLCWAAHKCSKAPKVNIEALKRQHAEDAKAFDAAAATLAAIKEENQMRRQQVINWNKYLVEETAWLEKEQNGLASQGKLAKQHL